MVPKYAAARLLSALIVASIAFPQISRAIYLYDTEQDIYESKEEKGGLFGIRLVVAIASICAGWFTWWAAPGYALLVVALLLWTRWRRKELKDRQLRASIVLCVANPLYFVVVKAMDIIHIPSPETLAELRGKYYRDGHSFESFWLLENVSMVESGELTQRMKAWLAISGFNRNVAMALCMANICSLVWIVTMQFSEYFSLKYPSFMLVSSMCVSVGAALFLARYLFIRLKYFEYGLVWACLTKLQQAGPAKSVLVS